MPFDHVSCPEWYEWVFVITPPPLQSGVETPVVSVASKRPVKTTPFPLARCQNPGGVRAPSEAASPQFSVASLLRLAGRRLALFLRGFNDAGSWVASMRATRQRAYAWRDALERNGTTPDHATRRGCANLFPTYVEGTSYCVRGNWLPARVLTPHMGPPRPPTECYAPSTVPHTNPTLVLSWCGDDYPRQRSSISGSERSLGAEATGTPLWVTQPRVNGRKVHRSPVTRGRQRTNNCGEKISKRTMPSGRADHELPPSHTHAHGTTTWYKRKNNTKFEGKKGWGHST